jgi:hypothetical protein
MEGRRDGGTEKRRNGGTEGQRDGDGGMEGHKDVGKAERRGQQDRPHVNICKENE